MAFSTHLNRQYNRIFSTYLNWDLVTEHDTGRWRLPPNLRYRYSCLFNTLARHPLQITAKKNGWNSKQTYVRYRIQACTTSNIILCLRTSFLLLVQHCTGVGGVPSGMFFCKKRGVSIAVEPLTLWIWLTGTATPIKESETGYPCIEGESSARNVSHPTVWHSIAAQSTVCSKMALSIKSQDVREKIIKEGVLRYRQSSLKLQRVSRCVAVRGRVGLGAEFPSVSTLSVKGVALHVTVNKYWA